MRRVRTLVVVPAGPRDDVVDTVAGVLAYVGGSRHVVVLDDTRGARAADVATLRRTDEVTVLPADGDGEGAYGALWVKLGRALRFLLDEWDFDLLVRLDADAQMIGPGLADTALALLDADEGLGLLGSYRVASDGSARDFGPARGLLGRDMSWRNRFRDRALRAEVAGMRRAARRHGYEDGEHVLGACSLLPRRAVAAMAGAGYLGSAATARSVQGDDHLLGLAVRAAGFRIGDLGRPGDPLALRWKGLPAHPEELLRRHVAVTHSVRSWQDLDEAAVRAVFRGARERATDGGPVGA